MISIQEIWLYFTPLESSKGKKGIGEVTYFLKYLFLICAVRGDITVRLWVIEYK